MDEKLQSHFLNLFSFALADNDIDVSETETLYNIALSKGISKEQVEFIIDNPHKVEIRPPTNINELLDQLYDIAQIILADSKVDIREIKSLRDFIKDYISNQNTANEIIEKLIDGVKNKIEKEELFNELNPLLEMAKYVKS